VRKKNWGEKMNMKLWNFAEKVSGYKNVVAYIENYHVEDDIDREIHFLEIVVVDTDSETIIATYHIEAPNKEYAYRQAKFIVSEFLNDIETIIQ